MVNKFQNIIKDICKELDIKFELLSNDWIMVLTKNGIQKFIYGYKFELNSHSLGLICDDKYAMYNVLKNFNINVIEHSIVYSQDNKKEYAIGFNDVNYLNKLFDKYSKNVVLKSNNGTCGEEVEHIQDLEKLKEKFLIMSNKNKSLSICPYYEIDNEFRVIVLENKIKLIYKKEKPSVVGDGKFTIKELLEKFNDRYFKEVQDENLEVILENKKEYLYDWKFNLSKGARLSENIKKEDEQNISKIISDISKNINLGFCSVDIVKTKDKYYVIEINSGVVMNKYIEQAENGYSNAYNIYKDAIIKMFDN